MKQGRLIRYSMFGLLYFTQGTILSYFTALNALYLLEFGIDMTRIGIMGTIALIPFVIKVFLGMLSDKVNLLGLGHRKPYIVIGLMVQTLCLIFVPFINPGNTFWLYAAIAFLLQLGMALYDTCTDGLALENTQRKLPSQHKTIIIKSLQTGPKLICQTIQISTFWQFAVIRTKA